MEHLTKAYLFSLFFGIVSLFFRSFSSLIILIGIVVVGIFIEKDALARGLSRAHGLWALLGLIGVFIYHMVFARKK